MALSADVAVENLSCNERLALELLADAGGGVLVSNVPDRNERDVVFGNVTPGHPVYRKLEKRGLVFYTEEDALDLPGDALDGFQFTAEIYLTDAGREALKPLSK